MCIRDRNRQGGDSRPSKFEVRSSKPEIRPSSFEFEKSHFCTLPPMPLAHSAAHLQHQVIAALGDGRLWPDADANRE
eukprot:1125056-Pyramimonas_sp.AAC.1